MQTKDELKNIIETFLAAFHSSDLGEVNLNKIKELFIPQAMIIKAFGPKHPEICTVEQFIEPRQKILTDGTLENFSELVELSSAADFLFFS